MPDTAAARCWRARLRLSNKVVTPFATELFKCRSHIVVQVIVMSYLVHDDEMLAADWIWSHGESAAHVSAPATEIAKLRVLNENCVVIPDNADSLSGEYILQRLPQRVWAAKLTKRGRHLFRSVTTRIERSAQRV